MRDYETDEIIWIRIAPSLRESDELETSAASSKDKCGINPRMGTVVEGRFTTVSSNGKTPTDEDTESLQRLSFVSSSTGYSSARSSLRSSEIGEEAPSFQSRDFSIERRLLTREASLSESRRQKLLKNGNATQLDRIAIELLDTERCYVNDLNDIIQGYLNFFIDHREEFQMTVDDVSNTFGCIERIFIFNRRLYHQLDAALLNVALMAKCFIDNMDGFKDYVTYCTNYQKMVDTLSVLMKNNMVVETLALRQTILGHSLPLSAYLLKPVQRVLKYHLFMENILKHANDARDVSDTDRALIAEALHCMTKQAEKINEEKKRVEHWERVKELQSALHRWCSDDGEDLSRYGDLILEGTFKLAGSKTNRQLFLFEEMLMIVKERNGALICKDYIMCSNIMLNESISVDPLAFQVLSFDNPKVQYAFLSTSIEQKRQWMKELKRMMLDHYTVEIPERTKLLMLNMDTTNPKSFVINPDHDGTVYGGKGVKKIPKYLEKRRKSVDANTTVRRSQRRDRSNSRTRSTSRVSKASSTGSLIPVLSAVNIGLATKETPTACTCNSENNATPSTSSFTTKSLVSNGAFSAAPSLPFGAVDNSATAISSMFARRKSHDNSRPKLLNGKKRNGFLPPLPSATTMRNTTGSISDQTNAHNCAKRNDTNLASHSHFKSSNSCAKCTCNGTDSTPLQESSARISPSSANVSSPSASEHIENTFAELYKELNLLAINADNVVEKTNPAETSQKKCDMRQSHTSKKVHSSSPISANPKNEENTDRERRERSKSLSKFDDLICTSTPIPDSSLMADQSSEAFVVEPIDNNSEVFMNGSDFAKMLDEKMKAHASDTDETDDDDVPKGVNWTESPAVRNRLNNGPANVHHRRRSSQVAEQVWRLRHKNAMNKNVENCVDAKSFSSYTAPNNIPLRVTVTEYQSRKSSAPSTISPPYVKIAHNQSDRRYSSGLQLARQRTPLTVEQCAQLNEVLLDPSLGVVKEMVKQIEKPSRCATSQITPSTHKLLT